RVGGAGQLDCPGEEFNFLRRADGGERIALGEGDCCSGVAAECQVGFFYTGWLNLRRARTLEARFDGEGSDDAEPCCGSGVGLRGVTGLRVIPCAESRASAALRAAAGIVA